ncbi:hypothetical protein KBD71_01170 [Candidatus Woesebacteria bacterium]|nr:hypothetical protein [Candidatus Woesebacteria bacterium]
MNEKDLAELRRALASYIQTTSDQKFVHVRPRRIGEELEYEFPIYWDPQFFALVGQSLARPTTFLSSTQLTPGVEEKDRRVAKYIAHGQLQEHGIRTPPSVADKLVVLVAFPLTLQEAVRMGVSGSAGAVIDYFLDSDQRSAAEKQQAIQKIVKNRKRANWRIRS